MKKHLKSTLAGFVVGLLFVLITNMFGCSADSKLVGIITMMFYLKEA